MGLKTMIEKRLQRIESSRYHLLDSLYVPRDKKHIRRTRNIRLIPNEKDRRGGKYSYAEWAHVIGIFQTLMFLHLPQKEDNVILDAGCGTGLLAIASEPFVGNNGKYVGIDVKKKNIEFCRRHYPSGSCDFTHLDVANAAYASDQQMIRSSWPIESETFDLVVALSVWTHFNEEDSLFYFKEVARVLKPNSTAIVTFFLLDEAYRKGVGNRSHQTGRFHMTRQDEWVFDQPSDGSSMWFHPKWARVPENAIGVTEAGLELLAASAGMERVDHYQGNWKEVPGAYFQDVLVFRKS